MNDGESIQAENNSIAFGEIHVRGNVRDLRIGHTIGYTSEQVSRLIAQISTTFHPKPFIGHSPYKGLDVFEEEDAGLFFGREKWVENLVGRVRDSRTIFVTGPSGSGKSSLVRAGLIPTIKKTDYGESWLYATMTPERDPVEALAAVFARLKDPGLSKYFRENVTVPSTLHECAESVLSERVAQRLVLFLDQFEEVFTQSDKGQAEILLSLLAHAATVEKRRVVLLFSLRSDFISNCTGYPRLNELLNRQFVQIGAMEPDELVRAIALPALHVSLKIEPDLISQIINDMKGEPGALPLMQFALKDLFDAGQASGGITALTLDAYLQRGGIENALERHANAALDRLSDQERDLARNVFSRLIEIGPGMHETRRTALSNELVPVDQRAEMVNAVIQKLVNARLITTDETTVTISHEKLIDAWSWLKKLVAEHRELIALQNDISRDAHQWEIHGRETSYLYSGARLFKVREQLAVEQLPLSNLAQAFLHDGIEVEDQKRLEEEQRRNRELEDAHKLAESARTQLRAERRGRVVTIAFLFAALLLAA
jgi:energy-coupling factor transporter ATP-binding protein EcfA2